jgi:AraC-like DNA-binding protein
MKGIELLVEGCPVKTVAADVGYRQPNAFVELFRQTLGTTPKVWVATLQAQESGTTPNSPANVHRCSCA